MGGGWGGGGGRGGEDVMTLLCQHYAVDLLERIDGGVVVAEASTV